MADDFKDDKDMMASYRDHTRRWQGNAVAKPVTGEPKFADWTPKDFDRRPTPTEARAGTTFGVCYDSTPAELAARLHSDHFLPRIASDRRAYLVGTFAVVLGLLVMLGTIWLYTYRPAPSHVTLDNWCDRFSQALSCPGAENDAGKHN